MAPEEWDRLPDSLKARINEGLAQAEAGLGTPASEVIKRIREKYGLSENTTDSDEISAEEMDEIKEGLAQADRGQVIPHEEVMSKYQKWRK